MYRCSTTAVTQLFVSSRPGSARVNQFQHLRCCVRQFSGPSTISNMRPLSDLLVDGFARKHTYLRISITEKCNLRCTYCMPEEGVQLSPTEDLLTTPEILKLAKLFVSQGVSKIRLTGGEPTVRKDIIQLVQQLGNLRQEGLKEIAMTSNGIALNRKLAVLVDAGLTHLNLSLDTLDPFKYQLISRKNGLSYVLRSIDQALNLGINPLKINCVVIKNLNDDEILDFVDMIKDKPLHVRFIEYMPFDGNQWKNEKMVSYQSMLSTIRERHPSLQKDTDDMNDTSKTYKIDGHVGRIGFITSMTHNFCATCNRLRLTSDGNLKVCLFGNTEVSLRDMIRNGSSDDELLKVIGMAVKRKKKEHAGIGKLENMKNRPMILIGG